MSSNAWSNSGKSSRTAPATTTRSRCAPAARCCTTSTAASNGCSSALAEELNGGVPQGEQWHRQIVTDMSLEIPGVRPAVIEADLARQLGDYLRFRHVFRNVYGSLLEAERMRPLEERLPAVLATFRAQVRAFLAWTVSDPGNGRAAD